jgi:hypothetical protein
MLELKSVIRGKYLRLIVLQNYLLVPFFIYILQNNITVTEHSNILAIVILTALPAIGVTAFAFSKDGFYYETLMTKNIPVNLYVQGKILFLMMHSFAFYFLLFPIIINCPLIVIYTYCSGAIYYIGLGGVLMLYYSSFDKLKLNINGSPFFNYESFSFIKLLLVLPIITPLFFFEISRFWIIGLMTLLGVYGLLSTKLFIKLITQNLVKRKYFYIDQ